MNENNISIQITLNVILDEIDARTLDIFRKFKHKGLKVHQIRNILEYEGFDIGYGQIRYRLQFLSFVGILERERGNHTDRYRLRII
jgi:repressor of nif and glnA expression